jgi:uncharacterized protein (TIGR02172 family)
VRHTLKDNTLTLYPEGHIDTNNAGQFEKDAFEAIEEAQGASLVIDATNLEYISSSGLRVMMKLMKRTTSRIPVVNVSPAVFEIFDVTGFTDLLDVKKALRQVSVDGLEMIGSGGYGKVYRIDDETIVKVYSPAITLDFVERERDVSQKAFLMGVPTAISYDVVQVGDAYGVVYEMIDAKTTAQVIDADPSKIGEVATKSALLLKELHQIVPGPNAGLPDCKEHFIEWIDSLEEFLTEEETDALKGFIRSIPDRDTFLHGDFNAKNIMDTKGELLLIDIGDASIGHPIFDVAGLMLAYIILPNSRGGMRSDEDLRRLQGFDLDLAPQMWGAMCAAYFGLTSPEEIAATTKKLMPYCMFLMAYQAIRLQGEDKDAITPRIDRVLRERVLPALKTIPSLDFTGITPLNRAHSSAISSIV